MKQRYRVMFTLETDAPLDKVQAHFESMCEASHEVFSEDEDRAWEADMSNVRVERLP